MNFGGDSRDAVRKLGSIGNYPLGVGIPVIEK